ncbi:MAG: M42 family metallopeptidase [Chloroflexota bacterium]
MKSLIQKLVETPGPSGYEQQIRAVVRQEIEPLADEVRVDALGNLIARFGRKADGGQRILLSAHIDEIGVIATHIDENGFVRFLPVGGLLPRTCPGSRVRFLNGAQGVIGVERLSSMERVPAWDQMFIDLGVTSKAACPVRTGDMAVFERPFVDLGQRIVAKALDDRVGVAALIEALRRMKNEALACAHEVYFVFSIQEEVGSRGAAVAAFGIEPDLGIAVDVTGSGDTPRGIKMDTALGKGPAIKVRDQGMIADPRLVDLLVRTAEQAGIPYQMEVLERGSTDAQLIQLSRAGVPAGCISLPCRYIHSPSEMADMADVEQTVGLIVALLSGPAELERSR